MFGHRMGFKVFVGHSFHAGSSVWLSTGGWERAQGQVWHGAASLLDAGAIKLTLVYTELIFSLGGLFCLHMRYAAIMIGTYWNRVCHTLPPAPQQVMSSFHFTEFDQGGILLGSIWDPFGWHMGPLWTIQELCHVGLVDWRKVNMIRPFFNIVYSYTPISGVGNCPILGILDITLQ